MGLQPRAHTVAGTPPRSSRSGSGRRRRPPHSCTVRRAALRLPHSSVAAAGASATAMTLALPLTLTPSHTSPILTRCGNGGALARHVARCITAALEADPCPNPNPNPDPDPNPDPNPNPNPNPNPSTNQVHRRGTRGRHRTREFAHDPPRHRRAGGGARCGASRSQAHLCSGKHLGIT